MINTTVHNRFNLFARNNFRYGGLSAPKHPPPGYPPPPGAPPPDGLDHEETIVLINNQPVSKLIIRWKPVTGVSNYMVNYRFGDNNIVSATTSSPDFEIFNTKVGSYEVSVRSLNSGLEPSATAAYVVTKPYS